jgi:uncharacterized repeat protein (TIGR03803 family)
MPRRFNLLDFFRAGPRHAKPTGGHCEFEPDYRMFAHSAQRIAIIAAIVALLIAVPSGQVPTFTVLHSFNGTDGNTPLSLVQGIDGNLYGETGGTLVTSCGTIFKLNTAGILTTLHDFSNTSGDGCGPQPATLIQASDGRLYGGTFGGGSGGNNGTLFRIDRLGNYTLLHSFNGIDGRQPSRLLQASDGFFYGTTPSSAAASPGTFFKMDSAGNLTTLHSFSLDEGTSTIDGVIQGTDGAFYGAAANGGSTACTVSPPALGSGCGTIFRTDAVGNVTVIHAFTGVDGSLPRHLLHGADGAFYGVALSPGLASLMIFRSDTSGAITTFHTFPPSVTRINVLIQATDGSFFAASDDTVFKLDAAGNATIVHTFTGPDGLFPLELIQGTNLALAGVAGRGGSFNVGVVFRIQGVISNSSCNLTSAKIDSSFANDVVTATVSGTPCNSVLRVINTKPYWTNFRTTVVGPATVTPVAGPFNLYATLGVLPPAGLFTSSTVTLAIDFRGPAAVTIFADPTIESGFNAAGINMVNALLLALPLPSDVDKALFGIGTLVNTLGAYQHMPHLEAAARAIFQSNPSFSVALRELITFVQTVQERNVLINMLADLGFNISSQLAGLPAHVLNVLASIFGQIRTAFFGYPAGSIILMAQ